tara:strand:- start:359 stop:541 length:183 start_codon:yes stop_codon:yes gene_type:complete
VVIKNQLSTSEKTENKCSETNEQQQCQDLKVQAEIKCQNDPGNEIEIKPKENGIQTFQAL